MAVVYLLEVVAVIWTVGRCLRGTVVVGGCVVCVDGVGRCLVRGLV